MGDRSGSREPKGASLKKSKKNPGASAAKAKKASLKALGLQSGPVNSLPPPALVNDTEGGIFDAGVALLSRQFDRDRDRVIQRAFQEAKCFGMLTWFSDIEKQSQIADFCKSNSGICYFATGIHPDNIDRTNKKSHDDWLKQVEELGRKSECISILTGLNLSREMGTHFSQESLLKSSLEIADRIILPTTFHIPDIKSLERVFEILESEFLEEPEDTLVNGDPVFIIHDIITCSAAEERILAHAVMQHPRIYYSVSGAGITDPDPTIAMRAKQFVASLARDRLLVCSDSPWRTPQNLSDPYLRTLRNEPANLTAVILAVSEALGLSTDATASLMRENSLRVFNLSTASEVSAVAAAVSANHSHAAAATSKHSATAATNTTVSVEKSMQNLTLQDESVDATPAVSAAAAPATTSVVDSVYRCVKCRQLLFRSKDVTTHQLSAVKTVFKVGEEGLCSSFHFVPAAEGRDIHKRLGVSIRGGNVECSECGVKLGKFSTGDAVCPCGAVVHGPVAKVNATKIDAHLADETEKVEQLAERSRLENEDAQRQAELEAQEEEMRLAQATGRVRKSKKHKSENKGNFSSFRNKSFIPNASKGPTAEKPASSNTSNNSTKKGKNSSKSIQEDENEDEEDANEGEGEDENEENEEEGDEEENEEEDD